MGPTQVLPAVGLADQVRLLASTAGESAPDGAGTPAGLEAGADRAARGQTRTASRWT